MSHVNPYAPPIGHEPARVFEPSGQGFWREGDVLVLLKAGALPDRCIVCNDPAAGFRLKQKLFWHPPLVYVLLVSPLIYVLVALIVRQSAVVHVGLCSRHRARRRNGILIGWLGSALSVAGCSAAIAADTPAAMLGALAVFLLAVIVGIVMSQVVRARKIDTRCAWLRVGPPFLASIAPTVAGY